jgi:hypothetical protein
MRPEQLPEPTRDETNFRLFLGIVLGCLPLGLWLALNYVRPDLIAPMLQHVFGYAITAVELLCVLGGLVVYVVAATQRTAGARIGISIAAFFVCTLPAALMMIFGPVVFAFMYGGY